MIMRAKTSEKPSGARMEKKKSKFVYKRADPKKIQERANQSGSQYDGILKSGIDTFRSKEGDNNLRILPGTWDDHEHYGYDVWSHERVGVDKGSYPCLAKMKKQRCPICEAALECTEAGEEEEAKKLQPKRKVVAWVLDRADDNLNPLVWVMSWTMDRDITNLRQSKKSGGILDIDHPDEGYDVTFKRKGTGLQTRYIGIAIDRESTAISESSKQYDSIMDHIQENPVPTLIKYYDAKALEQIIKGTAEEKDDELDGEDVDDEEDRPAKSKAKAKSKSRSDDEDDDEAPFDTDDEDAEEKPRKSKRRDDDEEDEEEEKPRAKSKRRDDDEDEEKPAKSSKRKPARDEDEDDDDEEESNDDEESQEEGEDETTDEDEDEGEEEETPKQRRLKSAKGRR